jgi:cytochrome c-type biogenesis protein CcmH
VGILVAALLGFIVLAAGCGRPAPTLEQRAQALDRQLICPVCPGETLDQSGVQIAKDMRVLIRERLAAGDTEEAIKAYFVDRYGTRILAEPPASGISLAVWVIPPVVLAAGAAALWAVVREMRRRAVAPRAEDESLGKYLGAVDDELGTGKRGAP